jgi:hypothetical protein
MEDRTIHPSMKTVWAAYGVVIVLILAGIVIYFEYVPNWPLWAPAILLTALVPPVKLHLRRRMVTVRQTLAQRILGVGDLMLESAGESGAMAIGNLDGPREIADEILAASKRSHGAGTRGGMTL